ncbi:hypothetical protein O6H91_22G003900 [Diphasiastrum complanatum]|uniref:Uncharacterized protein n=1 Tax=Diphasiastrum complanatum TaxID=34168 RepID=A0ACC2ACC8_DIPCM|nr:hypothetical protein O6H91_22G003900 [Diphasiastrum complanatum]
MSTSCVVYNVGSNDMRLRAHLCNSMSVKFQQSAFQHVCLLETNSRLILTAMAECHNQLVFYAIISAHAMTRPSRSSTSGALQQQSLESGRAPTPINKRQ